MKYLSAGFIVTWLLVAAPVTAVPINPATCTNDSVTLNHMSFSTGSLVSINPNNLLLDGPYDASSCVGIYAEPNNVGSYHSPNPNIGWLNDGLLNGEGGYLSPTQFIDADELLDLGSSPGNAVDPGWISLVKFERDENEYEYQSIYDTSNSSIVKLDLDLVLDVRFSCTSSSGCTSGTWALATSLDIVDLVQAALGNRSTFDHLAFVFKSGNKNSNGGWSVYDFNFKDIFANELAYLNDNRFGDPFGTPFTFSGTFNMDDYGKDISHFAIWARDPLSATTKVPAPASVFILGLGLVIMRLCSKRG
ncbi:MAG: hypothetical protein KKE30_15295 [Gammaproteobacteria bacterium]|nr:hypothetical protein [Gammaproteobacteria bacterium]MBU1553951.1 hypothetical protein [Gammaproteobacteria bacterium]MBU2071281.1 hypothetical protein [Gammaproteobacteria bacterium]MBU2181688.1 hypothetical protein [Gammaproteobacteria bacterium]MBU2205324.1 hypothetical protein [Gammaproteobacteria bacterium]